MMTQDRFVTITFTALVFIHNEQPWNFAMIHYYIVIHRQIYIYIYKYINIDKYIYKFHKIIIELIMLDDARHKMKLIASCPFTNHLYGS